MKLKVCTYGFLFAILLVRIGSGQVTEFFPDEAEIDSHRCGTQIDFVEDETTAFEKARKSGRPVYVLHLSGNLKNETFT